MLRLGKVPAGVVMACPPRVVVWAVYWVVLVRAVLALLRVWPLAPGQAALLALVRLPLVSWV